MNRVFCLENNGDWYVVPYDLRQRFWNLTSMMLDDEKYIKEFKEKFDKYKTGGDINLVPLYAEL